MIDDGRALPAGTGLDTDVAIIGGGAAGISLALALDGAPFRVLMIESGGEAFSAETQALYQGSVGPQAYGALDGTRLRFFGGSTNHWGGWCRTLDPIDFAPQPAHGFAGWPIGPEDLAPYLARAQALCDMGPAAYDDVARWERAAGAPVLPLGTGGVETRFFQYSPPTRFGAVHGPALRASRNVRVLLNLNAVDLRLGPEGALVEEVALARLDGARMTLRARHVVLACGGIETARLLLNADSERPGGLANSSGLVGRYFMDHPLVAATAQLAVFGPDGLAPFYPGEGRDGAERFRATLMPADALRAQAGLLGSLTTVDRLVARARDATRADGLEALDALASTLAPGRGGEWSLYELGCGLEPLPDPDSRVHLTTARDALGLRQVHLDWRLPAATITSYAATLERLGAQLAAAGAGVLRIAPDLVGAWPGNAGFANHHIGTLRMGEAARTSVVTRDLRTHDVGNLFVAGSGVFPTAGAANPTLTIVMLALRLADHLRGLMR